MSLEGGKKWKGALTAGVQPNASPPVIVLESAPVVVRLHGS